ncbi:hypothetical protein LX36DRAFT_487519 [Colletotrichum falcatum]|nr:hypothetical protein LX36DRAFT_487519 [Colletotrichum falcatum]
MVCPILCIYKKTYLDCTYPRGGHKRYSTDWGVRGSYTSRWMCVCVCVCDEGFMTQTKHCFFFIIHCLPRDRQPVSFSLVFFFFSFFLLMFKLPLMHPRAGQLRGGSGLLFSLSLSHVHRAQNKKIQPLLSSQFFFLLLRAGATLLQRTQHWERGEDGKKKKKKDQKEGRKNPMWKDLLRRRPVFDIWSGMVSFVSFMGEGHR